jgi:hypothetical protein
MSSYQQLKLDKELRNRTERTIEEMASLLGRSLLYEDGLDVLSFRNDLCRSLFENDIVNEDDIFKVIETYTIKNKSFWSSYPSLFYKHPITRQTIEVLWNNGERPRRGLLIGAD